MGCPSEPSWALVECLSKVDPQKLSIASTKPELITNKTLTEEWVTVIDGEFLDDVPYQLFKQGRSKGVEMMHGFGQHDTGYFILNWVKRPEWPEPGDKEGIDNFYRTYYSNFGVGDMDAFMEGIREHFGDEALHPSTIEAVERDNDRARVTPHILDLKYHENFLGSGNHYLYVLDHHATFSDTPDWMRGDHVETCVFPFGIGFGFPDYFKTNDEEKRLMDDMLRYQLNFAKTGNPNLGSGVPTSFPRWNMETRELLRFQASSCGYRVEKNAYKGVEDFWETLVSLKQPVDKDRLCLDP